jgi:hypothetical protein
MAKRSTSGVVAPQEQPAQGLEHSSANVSQSTPVEGGKKPKPKANKPRGKGSVAIRVALITAAATLVAAVIGLAGRSGKEVIDVPGMPLVHSTNELNGIITARWLMIDEFLKTLQNRAELDTAERLRLAELREQVRMKHERHANALKDGNAVQAHEYLRSLQASLTEVDAYLTDLRTKHPELASALPVEQRESWQGGVAKQISYEVKKESWFEWAKRLIWK